MPVIVTNEQDTVTLPDLIVTHNTDRNRHYPELSYRNFLLLFHVKSGLGPLLPEGKVRGEIEAHISVGRWCVLCGICRSAVVAEPTDPFFCCVECGSGGAWRRVIFPREREEIETVLLLRPGFRGASPARSWFPNETVDDLRRENLDHGDPVDKQPEPLVEEEV